MKVVSLADARSKRTARTKPRRDRLALMIVDGRHSYPALFDDERDVDRLLAHHPAFRYAAQV